jgi:Apea-like HEPN
MSLGRLNELREVAGKDELRTLAMKAVEMATARREPLESLRGTALHDESRDEKVTSLDEFPGAVATLTGDALIAERYGEGNAQRLTIQFVYEVGWKLDVLEWSESAFEEVWQAFCGELEDSEWVSRGLANMRYFQSGEQRIDLPDGVSVRRRSFEELERLGFDEHILGELKRDWAGFGASSYVMMVEDRMEKKPENFNYVDSGHQPTKALRALGALRLAGTGDVGIGRMWSTRTARFNVGIDHVGSTLSVPETMGSPYRFSADMFPTVADLYVNLKRLEREGYNRAAGNLQLALRSFMATFDRYPTGRDAQLVDSITALEAVLGTSTEISFRLAFRVAGLLADSDQERASLLEDTRGFYDTRSRIVHGGPLSNKQRGYLDRIDEARDHVRRLLRGFVHLAVSEGHGFDRKYFEKPLDGDLLQEDRRAKLREAMGLA